jgi:methylmalonyl-CoA/ethylmalonyl-CoA epimerase
MRLVQVAVHADDLDRAEAFYANFFDAQPTGRFDPPGLLFFDVDGTRLLLDRGAPQSLLYFEVTDIHGAVENLRTWTRVISEPHVIFTHEDDKLGPAGTQEWQAFVSDSEGNTIGLVEFVST